MASILSVAALLAVTAALVPTAASVTDSADQCVLEVRPTEKGELEIVDERCFATFDRMLRSLGYGQGFELITPENVDRVVAQGSGDPGVQAVIAIHYDYQNYVSPPSFAVSGTSCTGGYINFDTHYSTWNNRIESTQNYCGGPAIRLYDNGFGGGLCNPNNNTVRSFTSSEPSHGTMNNRASCVKYGGSA